MYVHAEYPLPSIFANKMKRHVAQYVLLKNYKLYISIWFSMIEVLVQKKIYWKLSEISNVIIYSVSYHHPCKSPSQLLSLKKQSLLPAAKPRTPIIVEKTTPIVKGRANNVI